MNRTPSKTPAGKRVDQSSNARWILRFLVILMITPAVMILGCRGCQKDNDPTGVGLREELNDEMRAELLTYAMKNLNRLEDFNSNAMLQDIRRRLESSMDNDGSSDTLMKPWPESEMMRQVVQRLNQWIEGQEPLPDWEPDPLVAALPDPLNKLPLFEGLGKLRFPRYDGLALRETVWLRDISNWARGDELDDLSRAKRLFDWTIRNIQLQPPNRDANKRTIPFVPWENLLFGRGTPLERGWVFVLLARQQGLDAAIIALGEPPADPPAEDSPSSEKASDEKPAEETAAEKPPKPRFSKSLQPWTVGVLIEGKVYLFEPALGLPIPAPDGIRLDETGQLDIQPATLAQVIEDDSLLRQFDSAKPYGLKSSDLKHVVALIEASPIYVAQRMRILESHVAGKQKLVLSIDATDQAKRFAESPHIAESELWTYPYLVLHQRSHMSTSAVQEELTALLPFYEMTNAPLGKARMLYLKNKFKEGPEGQPGAIKLFQKSRLSQQELEQAVKDMEEQFVEMNTRRLEKQVLEGKLSERRKKQEETKIRQRGQLEARARQILFLRAKQAASYWLGLLAFERENYTSAIDYFGERTINATPNGAWTEGALYNLGRSYEALKQPDEAIGFYEAAFRYRPIYIGCLVRAKWLREMYPKAEKPPTPQGNLTEPDITEPENVF